MFSSSIVICFAALLAADVFGQQPYDNCANVTPMPNFNASQMNGLWYFAFYAEISIVVPYTRPGMPRCGQRNYTAIAGGSMNVHTEYYDQNDVFQTYDDVLNPVNGVLASLSFQNSPYNETDTFIKTDYVGFALSANCVTVDGVRGYFLAINLRQKTLQLDVATNILKALQDAGLSGIQFNEIDQSC